MTSTPADPAARPPLVTRAYWTWTISGALMAAYSIVLIVASVIDGAYDFVIYGAFFTAIGAGLIVGARKVVVGDARWRSALAVFTLVLVAFGVMASLFIQAAAALPLVLSVAALFGSILAYRPESDPWFEVK